MELEENILTRFVIVEKNIGIKYHTPRFNIYGERSSWFSSVIFVSPGVYTIERDFAILNEIISKSEERKFIMDLVPEPGFSGLELETSFFENNTISLFKEKNGKYRDTS